MYDDIMKTIGRGEHAAAVDQARAAAAAAPDDAVAHRLLGLALALVGDQAAANASLDRALALAPDDATLRYQRAVILFDQARPEDARAELGVALRLNPNHLHAYILQAQIALAAGDLDEAERLSRLAARINPQQPRLLVVQGLAALHREDFPRGQALIQKAVQLAPEDLQARYALGMAYLAQGHLAFAEASFQQVLERNPASLAMRQMLADVIRRQGRPGEAADLLEPALSEPDALPDLLRYAGELRLVAGDHARALPLLRRAVAGAPEDRPALDALIEALRRTGDWDDARATVEAALAVTPHIEGLWSARLAFEPMDDDPKGVIDRWQAALPESVHPLHAAMSLAAQAGASDEADTLARRIIDVAPGHVGAQIQVIAHLFQTDPAAAVAHMEAMLPNISNAETLAVVRGWLGRAQDRAGIPDGAVATWSATLAADTSASPLPGLVGAPAVLPPLGDIAADAAQPLFLYGPPGSGVERVAAVLKFNQPNFRADRTGPQPPPDLIQSDDTAGRLASGQLDGKDVVDGWREYLPERGIKDGQVGEWLPRWDNALLVALRPHLPEAMLLLVLRDPRDMLLDWLAGGPFVRFRAESPLAIATWLAAQLDQLAALVEQDLFPHRLMRLDETGDDPLVLAAAIGGVLDLLLQAPETVGPVRFPAGDWRRYADALAEPFAVLSPVAVRLGYSAT